MPQLAAALHIDAGRDGQAIPEAHFDAVVRETSELIELAAARDPLDRLAAATGGRVLADHEAGQLAPMLRARTKTITRTEEIRLWDQPAALVLFFGLLTIEWVARSAWDFRDSTGSIQPGNRSGRAARKAAIRSSAQA